MYRITTPGLNNIENVAPGITGTTFVDTAVVNGTTYYYVTTAVDSSGTESAYSNVASGIIP